MSTDLVICVYDEKLGWIVPLQKQAARTWIYDKWDGPRGDVLGRLEVSKDYGTAVIPLPDVGKNDHAWLHHIVEHYDDLAAWNVFTVAHPFDHLYGATMEDALVPADCLRVPRLWRGRDWDFFSGRIRWHHMGGVPDRNGTTWKDRYESGKITRAALPFAAWCREYVGFDPDGPDYPGYQPGGILAVPRHAITYLPREFYARLREQVSHSVEPEEGHYCERIWVTVFSGRAKYVPASGQNQTGTIAAS